MFNLMRKDYRILNLSIFISCIILYGFNTIIFSSIHNYNLHYFFSSYFNDLLAPLLLFSYINLILSLTDKKMYSLKYLILIIILTSFVWEYIAPIFKPTSISDPIDILFYFIGTLIYWIIYKIWNQKSLKKIHYIS